MVDYKYFDLFIKDSIDKQVKIEYAGGTITNTELFSESMELTESLCSESELRFGCCEASILKFKVANIMQPLIGKWLTVSETLNGNTDVPFQIGKYKVSSDKPTADRKHREIVAYDAMYDIINADVANWYNSVLPNKESTMTMKNFRTSFMQHFGLEQEEIELVNDGMTVEKTIEPAEVSGKDVITAICEINGCFGHIGRDGKFHYIYLNGDIQGLYPADNLYPDHAPEYMVQAETGHLYPQDPKSLRVGARGDYISCQYEDFLVKSINKLQIRQEENDIGTIIGEGGDNCYIIEDNFLVYGKSADELWRIANNIFNNIVHLIYRPYELEVRGNPCLEVGDAIRVSTRYELVESYILKRTLKGIQALRDSYSAEGEEYRNGNVNGIQKYIIQLKGKTNILTRTVEETRSTITDVEAGLQSDIVQTAESIKMTVAKSQAEWDTSNYNIEIFSYGDPNHIIDEKENLVYPPKDYEWKLYLDQETGTVYLSDGAKWNYVDSLEKITKNLSSEIKQTAESINLEVVERVKADKELKASINVTADKITQIVSKTITKWDTTGYNISATDLGQPDADKYPPVQYTSGFYLDQTTGNIYYSDGTNWVNMASVPEVTKTLQSKIEQNEKSISLKVEKEDYNGNKIASLINQTATTIAIKAKKINLNGAVTANDNVKISTDGKITAKNATIEGTIKSSNAVITGGRINVDTANGTNDNVKFNYDGITVWMGSFGFQSAYNGQRASMQYNEIYMESPASGGTGTVHIKATEQCVSSFGWGTSSDRRLKKDIKLLDKSEAANFVYSLQPSEYVYIYDNKNTCHHGLIAQDVLASMEDGTWGLYGEQEERDGSKYATLNYSELIPDLISTVQLQKEEIESLKNDVEELKSQILKLSGGNSYE